MVKISVMLKTLPLLVVLLFLSLMAEDPESHRKMWSQKLTEMGLEDRNHAFVLEEEMKIQVRLLKIKDLQAREKTEHDLHFKKAKKLISAYGFGKYSKDYRKDCQNKWSDWWFLGKKDRISKLQNMFDELEEDEVLMRRQKAMEFESDLFNEMNEISIKNHMQVTEKARSEMRQSWEALLDTPLRKFKDQRKRQYTAIKRMGYHPKAVKRLMKTIDSLFE